MGRAGGWRPVTPTIGEVWLADLGAERRQHVYVASDSRFHRLAERALVAPVLAPDSADPPPPWWIPLDGSFVAVERLASLPIERLLDHTTTAPHLTVRQVQRVIALVAGLNT